MWTWRCLHVLLSAALLSQNARAQSSGDFSVLAMNVAGLPAILQDNGVPGDKTTNSELIGSYFAQYGYDVIHVQEDFNYHAAIYETDNHPYRTATSGGVPFGSGLNTLANFNWVDFTRVEWDTCSNASGADCLTPKGFTFMRVAITTSTGTSVYVDFYNLHTDAGTEAEDLTARQSNVLQVRDYIATWSVGNAVVVFGDTNSRYSRTADTGIRELLAAGFSDAWVETVRGGVVPTVETLCDNPSTTDYCETVDKVFYRSSPLVTLTAEGFHYASSLFLQPNGSILSDHNPVNVNFTWTAGSQLRQSDYWGGPHGTWFSDVSTVSALSSPKVSVISFRGASRVDSVGLTLTDGTTVTHGGSGGNLVSKTLGSTEYWTSATLCQAQYNSHTRIFYIQATTSTGQTLSAGTSTSDCVTYTAPTGWQIVGYLGQDGDEIDQLGLLYAPQ